MLDSRFQHHCSGNENASPFLQYEENLNVTVFIATFEVFSLKRRKIE